MELREGSKKRSISRLTRPPSIETVGDTSFPWFGITSSRNKLRGEMPGPPRRGPSLLYSPAFTFIRSEGITLMMFTVVDESFVV